MVECTGHGLFSVDVSKRIQSAEDDWAETQETKTSVTTFKTARGKNMSFIYSSILLVCTGAISGYFRSS